MLSWLGNFINFLILVYVTLAVVNMGCFGMGQLLVTVLGLVIAIVVNVYVGIIKRWFREPSCFHL